ncbi:MAG: pseudouridine synthase, partial [Myxococcales bacterium]
SKVIMERLQKILARAGIAARRKAEELIVAGRVRVDGRIVSELGTKADPRRQRIEVDGKRITQEPFLYVLLHKPRGVMCTASDPEGRPTVTSLVSSLHARLVPVGRLDYATSGVLLLSNDGDFAMGLLHPKRKVEKIYVCKVQGRVSDAAVERLKQPVVIDGHATKPISVRVLREENGKTWLEIGLEEGKNRQIRRTCEEAGFTVMRLVRTEFAGLTVEDLRPGEFRMLTLSELRDLQKLYGVPKRLHAPVPIPEQSAAARGGSRGGALFDRAREGRSDSRPGGANQRGRTSRGSRNSSGSDQSDRKKPAARRYASEPSTGSPAAASVPWSKTTKSGNSAGKARTRQKPSGPFAVTTPKRRPG